MKIAIISDTHDRLPLIRKAVKMINNLNIDLVIHCGDYSAPFAVNPYQNLKATFKGIYGNNDAERRLLKDKVENIGGEILGAFAFLTLDGIKIAVTHGDDINLLDALISSRGFDIIAHGHTHEIKLEWIGGTMILNPGEVCGYLTGESAFATVDLQTREVQTLSLSEPVDHL